MAVLLDGKHVFFPRYATLRLAWGNGQKRPKPSISLAHKHTNILRKSTRSNSCCAIGPPSKGPPLNSIHNSSQPNQQPCILQNLFLSCAAVLVDVGTKQQIYVSYTTLRLAQGNGLEIAKPSLNEQSTKANCLHTILQSLFSLLAFRQNSLVVGQLRRIITFP